MKPIVHVPNSILTTPTKKVTVFDDKLGTLIKEMKDALLAAENPKGVGLAATQIGVGYNIFLTKPSETSKIRVFINPEIIKKADKVTGGHSKLEGCLSIPNIWGKVQRAPVLTLRYQDETGGFHEEEFKGFIATIIQHETDHCNGVLYTQRVLEQKGKLYQVATDNDGKEILEEMSI